MAELRAGPVGKEPRPEEAQQGQYRLRSHEEGRMSRPPGTSTGRVIFLTWKVLDCAGRSAFGLALARRLMASFAAFEGPRIGTLSMVNARAAVAQR